jgi:hypothetical protein
LETISKGECHFVGIDDPVLIQTHLVWIRLADLGKFVRNWGRFGTNGLEIVEVFATEIEAEAVLEASARAKRRRGYGDL